MKIGKTLLALFMTTTLLTSCQGEAQKPSPAPAHGEEVAIPAQPSSPSEEVSHLFSSLYGNDLISQVIQGKGYTIQRGEPDIYPLLAHWYQLEFDLWVKGIEQIESYQQADVTVKPEAGHQFWMFHVALLNRDEAPSTFQWKIELEMKTKSSDDASDQLSEAKSGEMEAEELTMEKEGLVATGDETGLGVEILPFTAKALLFDPVMAMPAEAMEKADGYAPPGEMLAAYVIYEVPSTFTYGDIYALQGKLTTRTFENRELTLFTPVLERLPNHDDWLVVNGALYIQGDHVVTPEYMQAAIRGEKAMAIVREQVSPDTPLVEVKNGDATMLNTAAVIYPVSPSMVLNARYSAVVVHDGDAWHYYYRPAVKELEP